MKKMKSASLLLLLAAVASLARGLSLPEDDLVFDDAVEETPTSSAKPELLSPHKLPPKKWQRVEKLLGLPDAVAAVGHVFKLHIPKQAFSGSVDYYKVQGINGKSLAHWLRWDEPASALYGVPSRKDVGRTRITIKAVGKQGDAAEDSFTVHVVPERREHVKYNDDKKRCSDEQDRIMVTILADTRYDSLRPRDKVNALENLAGFLGLPTNAISIQPDTSKEIESSGNQPDSREGDVILSGPGNVGRRQEKHSTIVQWQIGCNGHFWPRQMEMVKQLSEQSRDGTLSEVTQLRVWRWRVRNEPTDYARNRREIAGSGDGFGTDAETDYEDGEDGEDEEDEYDYDAEGESEGVTKSPPRPTPSEGSPRINPIDEHPHRHHHGEDSLAGEGDGDDFDNDDDDIWANRERFELNKSTFNSSETSTSTTPSTYPVVPETYPGSVSNTPSTTSYTIGSWNENATDKGESLDPYDTMHVSVISSSESYSTSTTTPSTTAFTTTESTTTSTTEEPSSPTPEVTSPPTTSSTTPSTTTTTTSTTPSTTTTERENKDPEVTKKLKKISITQGKVLSYTIPEDTFEDEDGNTRNLRLRVTENGAPLKPSYWLQFNEVTQEVYGLPLQDQYGSYPFEVIATDSEGKSVSAKLDISVQQHKQQRAVNHQFSIYLKLEKRSAFPTDVDWELKVLRSLTELYGDDDSSHITVRLVKQVDRDNVIYTWTNDSLVRSSTCPHEDIDKLLTVLLREEKSEDPSTALEDVLGPEIKVKRVIYEGFEQCRETKETPTNKYPIPVNQIDQLNATVGQLFSFKVPRDTFYDEEDGDTSRMRASLLTANRSEIPEINWLQFDSSNQEFYGVPLQHDIGQKIYQLVVKDKEGLEATDSLVVQVHNSPIKKHVLEVKMVLNTPYESFINSAQKKRTFIEKLQKLYNDKNSNAISILSVARVDGGTAITWRNLTLPTDKCPSDDISRIKRVLINAENEFTFELSNEFKDDAIEQITPVQKNVCSDLKSKGIPVLTDDPTEDDSTVVGARYDEYLITFVLPAIIIAAMILLAGLIACILYKKRRSGKMSISEKDNERQSFRSKGIPVIFQDELEEKPDPGNKSPIILKEEKPPLPPPEYQRAEDGADIPMLSKEGAEEPYQPPPPFATARDSNSRNRPKPTPTYRKPPPYVPP